MLFIIKNTLYYTLDCITWLILIRCLLSWINLGENKFTTCIFTITEPILAPIRNLTDRLGGGGMMIDFSPIIAYLIIVLIQQMIYRLL